MYGCIVVIIADVILYIILKYFMAKESKVSKDSKVRNRINVNDIVKGLEDEDKTNIKKNKGKH